jgi:protein O-mannosyl-transferase
MLSLKEFSLNSRFSKKYLAAVLIIFGLAVYAPTFSNGMFLDDYGFILDNRYLRDWQYLPQMFSQSVMAGAGFGSSYWRPMLSLVFSLEWHAWQAWPGGYHMVSTAFHIGCGVLLFFILDQIFKKRTLAFLTALIFLIHPLQTEGVAYVSASSDSLSGFFMLFALWLFIKARQGPRSLWRDYKFYFSWLAYILALMSRETAIVLPGLVLLVGYFIAPGGEKVAVLESTIPAIDAKLSTFPKRFVRFIKPFVRLMQAVLPFLAIAAIYLVLRFTILNFGYNFNQSSVFVSNFWVRVLTFFRVLCQYFGLMFWPQILHMERTVNLAFNLKPFDVLFGALIFTILLIAALFFLPRRSGFSFGILWFFIAISVTSNIAVPINAMIYENWLYLPLIGIIFSLFWTADWLYHYLHNFQQKLKYFFAGVIVIVVCSFCIRSVQRNIEWRSPIAFYLKTLQYSNEAQYQKAAASYQEAIVVQPDNPVTYHDLGIMYLAEGLNDKAITEFKTAIKLDPKFTFSYQPLINLYLQQGNQAAAMQLYNQYQNMQK